MFWTRTDPVDRVLLGNQNAGDVEFDFSAGWRDGARRRLSDCWEVEGSYFDLAMSGYDAPTSDELRTVTSRIALVVPEITPDGVRYRTVLEERTVIVPARYEYGSDVGGAELNLRRDWGGHSQLLMGFRWLQLDERFVGISGGGSNYVVQTTTTSNDLFGFQLGTDTLLLDRCCGRLQVRGGLKAGIFHNRAEHGDTILGPQSFVRGSDDDLAFAGEASLGGQWRVTDCLSICGGYQLLWLSGVALASEQLALGVPIVPLPVDLGDVLLHGGYVGVEFRR